MEDIIVAQYARTLEITFVITDPKNITQLADDFRKRKTQLRHPFTRLSRKNYHTKSILNLKWLIIWRSVKFVNSWFECCQRMNKFYFLILCCFAYKIRLKITVESLGNLEDLDARRFQKLSMDFNTFLSHVNISETFEKINESECSKLTP
jgi:hypothetical protein